MKNAADTFWENEALSALIAFGAIPNVSPSYDPGWKKAGHMERAVTFLAEWVKARDIASVVIVEEVQNRTPLLYVEIKGERKETVLIYGHFDKQPDMPGWREGLSAWNPTLEGDYLYGRGLADDGWAIFAAIGAIEIAKKHGAKLPRIVLLIEGSEESGSEDLPVYLELLKEEIGTPSVIITLDSEGLDTNHLWLTESLRGLVNGTLAVETLDAPKHSGLATGVIPSVFRIARTLIARIEDSESGIIADSVINPSLPAHLDGRARTLAETVGENFLAGYHLPEYLSTVAGTLEESIERNLFRAGLEVTGLSGLPPVERAGNVTTARLELKLSLRIPPWAECGQVAARVKELLESNPPYGARITYTPLEMDNGWLAKPLSPKTKNAAWTAAREVYEDAPIQSGIGASIPFIGMMGRTYPEADQLVTGILSPSSNAHGPNENLHIPTVKRLTEWLARFLTQR